MSETQSAQTLGLILIALVVLNTAVKTWLTARQIGHVRRHRSQVPSQFASRIGLAAHQKAADYTQAKGRLGLVDISVSAIVLLAWTLFGGLSWLDQVTTTLFGPGFIQQMALLLSFAAFGALIDTPLALYQTFVIEARFGFNKTSWRLWLSDSIKSVLLGLAIGAPLIAIVIWLMQSAGLWWWLWAWLTLTAFNLLMMVVYPTLIAPLFNTFKPLEDASLKQRVEALMKRCGFSAKGLYVMDGSRRSAHANAYFTGFGSAKRVVFFDTLLRQLNPGEVNAVLAHELGHFKHKHVFKHLVSMFAMTLIGLALLGYLSRQDWFYQGLGVASDPGAAREALALILFSLTLPLVSFFISPVMSLMSRRHEFEADTFAVMQTSREDLSSALLKLYEDNASTLTPDPVYAGFYYSHPDAAQRLSRIAAQAA